MYRVFNGFSSILLPHFGQLFIIRFWIVAQFGGEVRDDLQKGDLEALRVGIALEEFETRERDLGEGQSRLVASGGVQRRN